MPLALLDLILLVAVEMTIVNCPTAAPGGDTALPPTLADVSKVRNMMNVCSDYEGQIRLLCNGEDCIIAPSSSRTFATTIVLMEGGETMVKLDVTSSISHGNPISRCRMSIKPLNPPKRKGRNPVPNSTPYFRSTLVFSLYTAEDVVQSRLVGSMKKCWLEGFLSLQDLAICCRFSGSPKCLTSHVPGTANQVWHLKQLLAGT